MNMMKRKQKTKIKNSEPDSAQKPEETNYEQEYLYLGHFIKYNLYLLFKSVIFSSIISKFPTIDEATEATNNIIKELDLDSKPKT
jgi:hypothetical protein